MPSQSQQVILVSGANGQLGKCLHDLSHLYPHTRFHFLGREHFSLEQFGMMRQVVHTLKPNVVINAAGYTSVDQAENHVELAKLINGEAVGQLAEICRQAGAGFLHVSTDYVFDGNGSKPYKETDPVNPVNQYGASKLTGEKLALDANPLSVVLRTSWVYSKHGQNFVRTMLRLMAEKESIGVVDDQFGCPTYAIDLAEALLQIADFPETHAGIYHFSNSGPISWFQFAQKIAELSKSSCKVLPITTAQFPTLAKRPAFSALSNEKIKRVYGIDQKNWVDSLNHCLQTI